MYATCLFCNHRLGHNEAIEAFPVGRRLAYDAAKGRLWVVCMACERWNLSPLEERWEAIDEAERAFQTTPLRTATDNVALAQLPGGLELVRIGEPPPLELAGWRYGDQFGCRRRRSLVGGAGLLGGVMLSAASLLTLSLASMGGALALYGVGLWGLRRIRPARPVPVPDGHGGRLRLTWPDIDDTRLMRVPEMRDWCLQIEQHGLPFADDDAIPGWLVEIFGRRRTMTLRGDDAQRALASMLPHLNGTGGSARRVREAVAVIGRFPGLQQLLYSTAAGKRSDRVRLVSLPAPVRLALEMVLHEDDEQRAMAGELAALERRWREAEEIAAIADALLLPAGVRRGYEALRAASSGSGDRS